MTTTRAPDPSASRVLSYLGDARITSAHLQQDAELADRVAHDLKISRADLFRIVGIESEPIAPGTEKREGDVSANQVFAAKVRGDRAKQSQRSEARPRAAQLRGIFGPMGDLFHLDLGEVKHLDRRIPANRAAAEKLEAFRAQLSVLKEKDDIKRFAAEHVEEKLSPEQRTLVLEALRNKGIWPDAVAFYDRSVALDARFARYPIPAEFHLVALNKTEQFGRSTEVAKRLVRDLAADGNVNAFDLDLTSVQRSPWVNGETLSALGSAFKSIHDFRLAAKVRAEALELKASGSADPHRLKILEEEYKALTGMKSLDEKPLNPADDALVREECRIGKGGGEIDTQRKALEISTRYYEAGFAVDFEYYPGINAMYNHHLMGNEEKFEALQPLVKQSLTLAGGKRSKDYWCLGTQLEFALLTNDNREVREMLPLVLKAAKWDWELGTTAKMLVKLLDHRERTGQQSPALEYVFELLTKCRDGVEKMPITDERIAEIMQDFDRRMVGTETGTTTAAKPEASSLQSADIWSAIVERATYFAGMSSHYLGGNVPYGGLIPDLKVGRTDIDLARRVLDDLGVSGVNDFDKWNEKVDAYLSRQLRLSVGGRRVLEDMESPEHHFMERVRKKLLLFTGAKAPGEKKAGDCRTNLMAEVALGCVDCRQTAFSKQLLYDVWKKDNQNRLLRDAYRASLGGDGTTFRSKLAAAQRLDNEQLLTFSVMIRTPVRMKELYKPELDSAGARVRDKDILDVKPEEFNDYENHTFNARIFKNPTGDLSLEWRDCFYQQLYKWGMLPVIPEQIFEASGFRAGVMTPPDHEGKQIPVVATVQKYSRGKIEATSGEYGGFHVGGRETEIPPYHAFQRPGTYDSVLRVIDESLKEA